MTSPLKAPALPESPPGEGLTLQQRKFCQLMVTTSTLTDNDLSRMIGAPEASIRLWRKNKYCKAFIQHLTGEIVADREFLDKSKQTSYRLWEKMAVEVESRFDAPDMEYYKGLPDMPARMAYLDRFASQAAFKDAVRAFEAIGKSTRLLMPTEVESETIVSFQDMNTKIREQYEFTIKRRHDFEQRLMRGEVQAAEDPVGALFDYDAQMTLRNQGTEATKQRQRAGLPDEILEAEDATPDLMEVTISQKTTTRNPK